MVTEAPKNKRLSRGRLWKIVLGLLLLAVVGLVLVLLNIDAIARSQINKALDRNLVAGGNLEIVDVRLMEGSVVLSGLTINPPLECGPHPLMSMDHIEADVALLSLFRGEILIEQIVLKGLSFNVVRDENGRLSPMEMIPPSSPAPEPVEDNHETKPPWIPSVHVNSIKVEDLSFRLVDRMLEQDWSANLKVDMAVRGLRLQDILNLDILVDHLDVVLSDIVVDQPPGFSREPLMAVNRIEVASSDINLGASRVSVSEVKLDTLSASLERNVDREINLVKLIESWLPGGEDGNDDASDPVVLTTAADTSVPAFELPTLVVDNLQLKSVTAQMLDSIGGQPWRAGFDGLDVQVKGVEVGDLAQRVISLASFDLNLHGITVDQPPGYSETPLLGMDSFKLASQGIDLGASEVTVSDVVLETLSVSLERNADREINLLKIAESWLPATGEGSDKKPDPVNTTADRSVPAFVLPAIVVDNVKLASVSAQVLDSIDGQPWRAGFDGLDLNVTGVEVGDLSQQAISLATFDLDLKGLNVDQPPGFDTGKLFNLDQFIVISEKTDKSDNELVIKQVSLQGLTSSITMRADGVTNLQILKEALFESNAETYQPKASAPALKDASSLTPILPAVLFEKISLDGGPVTYRDEVFAEEPLIAFLDNIQLEVTGLRLFSDQQGVDPASTSLSFELAQPGELPTAYFGALTDVGPVGYGVPMVNSQVLLVGLKLDTLGTLVPPTTRTALGATGLDVGMAMAMDEDSINLNASVLTDHNIRYEGITVQGPLEKPVVSIGPIMVGVLGRVTDGLFDIGKSGLVSGVHIAGGGVDAAKELATGAVDVVANLGISLFNTTAGLLTLDKDKVQAGVSGTTKGTVDITKGSVEGSGKAAGGSLKSSASELKGQERINAWDQEIPSRYQTYMQFARKTLAEMPYPPVTE